MVGTGTQLVGGMRAVGDPQTVHTSIRRHLQIMRGITHHDNPMWLNNHLIHQLKQHTRMRFAKRLIGCTRRFKGRMQRGCREGTIQANTALTRCHGQASTRSLQRGQHLRDAIKQL